MTATRSATWATTLRSWVMNMTAASVSRLTTRSKSRISAWIVTSSAVVGSSAMMTLGWFAIAMAIMTRCRIPPENSCGYWSKRLSASLIPTLSSSSALRFRAARGGT